jgi:hypothetical protein
MLVLPNVISWGIADSCRLTITLSFTQCKLYLHSPTCIEIHPLHHQPFPHPLALGSWYTHTAVYECQENQKNKWHFFNRLCLVRLLFCFSPFLLSSLSIFNPKPLSLWRPSFVYLSKLALQSFGWVLRTRANGEILYLIVHCAALFPMRWKKRTYLTTQASHRKHTKK